MDEIQNILFVIDKREDAYERGLGCPADARIAIEKIKNAKKFVPKFAYVCSRTSGKDLHDKLQLLSKQEKILMYSNIESQNFRYPLWISKVVVSIK